MVSASRFGMIVMRKGSAAQSLKLYIDVTMGEIIQPMAESHTATGITRDSSPATPGQRRAPSIEKLTNVYDFPK